MNITPNVMNTRNLRKERSKNFTLDEINRLLQIVEEILPRGGNEWLLVSESYNTNRPAHMTARDDESLRNKFKSMRNVKKPTGDPSIPEYIRRAKLIYRQIEQRISVAEFDDGEGSISSDNEEDDDDNISNDSDGNDNGFTNSNSSNSILTQQNNTSNNTSHNYNNNLSLPGSTFSISNVNTSKPPKIPVPNNINTKKKNQNSSNTSTYSTTLRTGYNENQLTSLADVLSKDKDRSTPTSLSTTNKRKIDNAIADISNQNNQSNSFIQIYIEEAKQEKREARERENQRLEEARQERREAREREIRMEERRMQYEKEESERREKREERAEQFQREEAESRRQFNTLMLGMLAKFIDKN